MARKRQQTFADIVRSGVDKPARSTAPRLPPRRHDQVLVTSDRRRWVLVADAIGPDDAARLARKGGAVAVDLCGCGGACGLDMLDSDTRADLAHAAPPTVSTDLRYPGSLSHWISGDEAALTLVLASGRVSWGRALA